MHRCKVLGHPLIKQSRSEWVVSGVLNELSANLTVYIPPRLVIKAATPQTQHMKKYALAKPPTTKWFKLCTTLLNYKLRNCWRSFGKRITRPNICSRETISAHSIVRPFTPRQKNNRRKRLWVEISISSSWKSRVLTTIYIRRFCWILVLTTTRRIITSSIYIKCLMATVLCGEWELSVLSDTHHRSRSNVSARKV